MCPNDAGFGDVSIIVLVLGSTILMVLRRTLTRVVVMLSCDLFHNPLHKAVMASVLVH
jgi:hypothetical protein